MVALLFSFSNDTKSFAGHFKDFQGVHYPDSLYTPPSKEAMQQDIELAKSMGFNGARLHQKSFPSERLFLEDKAGRLNWGEMGSWGADYSDPVTQERFLKEWLEVVKHYRNHPSISTLVPFNEDNVPPEFLKRVHDETRKLDPTRIIITNSGAVTPEDEIAETHIYERTTDEFKQAIEDAISKRKTLFISNYSGPPQEAQIQIWPGFVHYSSAIHLTLERREYLHRSPAINVGRNRVGASMPSTHSVT